MQSNRHFADFWETNSAFFNSDTIGIINAPETIHRPRAYAPNSTSLTSCSAVGLSRKLYLSVFFIVCIDCCISRDCQMEYQTNSHCKYLISLHLILVVKYRKQLLVTRRPKQPENTFKSNVSFIDSSQRLNITGFSRRCSIN
jgi:hypothetical protein